MNIKNICLAGIMAALLPLMYACSQEEAITQKTDTASQVAADSVHQYKMILYGTFSGYDEDGGTRAASYSWPEGATLYLRFKTGTPSWSYTAGTTTYNNGAWTITTAEALPTISTAMPCWVRYFTDNASVSSSVVNMTEATACYFTEAGTFTNVSGTVTVNATLNPMTWRLRFRGTSGTTITLPSDCEMTFFNTFNRSSHSFVYGKKEVILTVGSTGYTPYIYGTFTKPNGRDTIKVKNGSTTYKRTILGSNLTAGESGCLTVPTSSSHSGWTMQQNIASNCTVRPNLSVTLTDGYATDFTVGSNVSYAYFDVISKSTVDNLSDEALIEYLRRNGQRDTKSGFGQYIYPYTGLNYNTQYYLCSIAYDSNGNRGELVRTSFSTPSTSRPIAETTAISVESDNKTINQTVSMKNGAARYYAICFANVNYSLPTVAWYLQRDINNGNADGPYTASKISWTATFNVNSVSVATRAYTSSGSVGNFHSSYWTPSSSSAKMEKTRPSGSGPKLLAPVSIKELESSQYTILRNEP